MTLPGQEAVDRLIQNESRFDKFLNDTESYTTRTNVVVESAPHLMGRLEDLTNAGNFSFTHATEYPKGSVGAKLNQYLSAFDEPFNAKGDFSDDTIYLQSLINKAESSYDPVAYGSNSPAMGPCECFIPSGNYKITSPLIITKKLAIRGDGPSEFSSGTRITQVTSNQDLFQVNPINQGMSVSFENLTLKSNTSGSGNLIHITRTTASCNSARIINCTFGTPQSQSIYVEAGDDLYVSGCLFDVSAGGSIALGGVEDTQHIVSNALFTGCNWFDIPTRIFLLYNVDGLIISSCRVSRDVSVPATQYFLDAYNSMARTINNIIVTGCNINGCDVIFAGGGSVSFSGLIFTGNNCCDVGNGLGTTSAVFSMTGIYDGVVITGNRIVGSTNTFNFFNNSGTATKCLLSNNQIINNGTTTVSSIGLMNGWSIKNNSFSGFQVPSISEKWSTDGNNIVPGVVSPLNSNVVTKIVTGAKQGDIVTICPVSTSWLCPAGIILSAFVSAQDTVSLSYTNVTNGNIGVPAHDISITVNR